MKSSKVFQVVGLVVLFLFAASFKINPVGKIYFPYREAGLTGRQAAAHLLGRFTFGARPSDVDEVVSTGLEKWFQQQLDGTQPDLELNERLKSFDLLNLTNKQMAEQFPNEMQVRQMAIQDGFISKDSISKLSQKDQRKKLNDYRKQKGIRTEGEIANQFFSQKIIRAASSENQLHEVLTDFWFNHFNVSMTKNQCARFIPAYERDAIRPNVVGSFEKILSSTAKSPAMLLYLDNASSAGENTMYEHKIAQRKRIKNRKYSGMKRRGKLKLNEATAENISIPPKERTKGLNENYAREVMELHTLGVDGGYTQADVTDAAKVLTGWTVYPMGNGPGANLKEMLDKIGEDRLAQEGFVHEGDFLFAINRHDSSPKKVLGATFTTGGYEEGQRLLKLLAHHPSTAKFISRKLAVHFVSDNPPQTLVDKMAKTFLETNGSISDILTTMVSSKEFWSEESLRSKIKSPFEYAIGAVRSLDGDIQNPVALNQWITRMGQRLYYYQAPTGFPDRGQYWINTGSLLNRMNFGLAIASKRIKGVSFDLAALNNQQEPESAEMALPIYARILLPERNLESTIQRLTPLIGQPDLQKNIGIASDKKDTTQINVGESVQMTKESNNEKPEVLRTINTFGNNHMLAQVVGIIIGSPEFQRR